MNSDHVYLSLYLLINVRYLWLIFSTYIYEGEVERVTKKASSASEGGMVHETVERSESEAGIIHTFNEKDMGAVVGEEWLWNIANICARDARDCHELY